MKKIGSGIMKNIYWVKIIEDDIVDFSESFRNNFLVLLKLQKYFTVKVMKELLILLQNGTYDYKEITKITGKHYSNYCRYLKILREAGIVRKENKGKHRCLIDIEMIK